MPTVRDLIFHLQSRNPNAQVFLMTQRKAPFENHLAGVVGREEMADQDWRLEPGIGSDDVFLVVGRRIRPGSLSAWIQAERPTRSRWPSNTGTPDAAPASDSTVADGVPEAPACDPDDSEGAHVSDLWPD
jgi:hypothetical protein